MASSKKKQPPSVFDFEDFLSGGPESGMQTAVRAMLHSPERAIEPDPGVNLIPGSNLLAGPDLPSTQTAVRAMLHSPERAIEPDPGVNLIPGSNLLVGPNLPSTQTAVRAVLHSPERLIEPDPGINLIPGSNLPPGTNLQATRVLSFPGPSESKFSLPRNPESIPALNLTPGVNVEPTPNISPGKILKRSFPIRQMKLAQDAHSRAEQAVYQKLWETAKPLDEVSRRITIGFGEMGRLVGLSESNARINTRMLIAKLAIEEHASYNCERGTGRTYRIFTYQEILNRRKQAGLTRYQRRTLAVVFVDEKDQPINLLVRLRPDLNLIEAAGLTLGGVTGLKLTSESGPNLEGKPGPNLGPLFREELRKQLPKEPTTTLRTLLQTVLPTFDDTAVEQLWTDCRCQVPDVSAEEVAALFERKLPESRSRSIENPNGFLLRSVARSCTSAAIAALRQGRELPRDQTIFIANDELEGLLNDPSTPADMRTLIELRLRGEH
jgi:hypothetical protein